MDKWKPQEEDERRPCLAVIHNMNVDVFVRLKHETAVYAADKKVNAICINGSIESIQQEANVLFYLPWSDPIWNTVLNVGTSYKDNENLEEVQSMATKMESMEANG